MRRITDFSVKEMVVKVVMACPSFPNPVSAVLASQVMNGESAKELFSHSERRIRKDERVKRIRRVAPQMTKADIQAWLDSTVSHINEERLRAREKNDIVTTLHRLFF